MIENTSQRDNMIHLLGAVSDGTDRRADFHVVNIGRKLATDALWGDGPAALPDCWGLLTNEEKLDFQSALTKDRQSETENRRYFTGNDEALRNSDAHIDRATTLLRLVGTVIIGGAA